MRVPLSWLRECADLPPATGREVAEALIRAGLEVETVEPVGHEIKNVVVGEVLEVEELTGFKKPIRYCRVEAGEAEPRAIVCGATNFDVGDRVAVALPGAVLPGDNPGKPLEVGARKTYGRTSEGMICSARELGVSDEHAGILVLPDRPGIGADVVELLSLRDEVLDIGVTPDRGYTASVRGVAREAATAYDVSFHDPADPDNWPGKPAGAVEQAAGFPARIADFTACDRFVLRAVDGLDREASSPLWMRRRLTLLGIRPISLPVDVTNYVMMELGQPLHAFDRHKLDREIVVRRAERGERIETLDHVLRDLHPEDILITDSSGPISMAGTMGGLRTEIDETSTDLVIEAAHFSDVGTARMSRRHHLSSESSYRFERGVDPELPPRASARAVTLLTELGGAAARPGGVAEAGAERPSATVTMRVGHPDRVAGVSYGHDRVVGRLRDAGCVVEDPSAAELVVTPPTWRPDLTDPNDLAEEVIRLEGYDAVPSVLPHVPPGRGLTERQRLRRQVSRALAAGGYTEVLSYPFLSARDWDAMRLPSDDSRRRTLRLANPLSDDEPLLRTTLLPGLFRALVRNVGRGLGDVALYEMGLVYHPAEGAPRAAPRLPVNRVPTEDELKSLEAALPDQPRQVAAVLAGRRDLAGWWGEGRAGSWADAIQAAREVAAAAGEALTIHADQHEPWHPGRCAAFLLQSPDGGDVIVGHAGELHPRVVEAYGLPARTCAMELDLSEIGVTFEPVHAPVVSSYPVATQDVALVVDSQVPAAEVASALRDGAGGLLESLRLFDVFTGEQLGARRKSLAYALRFRAPDRTLTVEEASAARQAAVQEAGRRTGAAQRGA